MLFVFAPAGAHKVAAHDALDGQHFGLVYEHGAARKLLAPMPGNLWRLWIAGGWARTFTDSRLAQPEFGHGGEYFAFAGDSFAQDYVKHAEAVGSYHEQVVARW